MKRKLEKSGGITLVALVVTIVVLLILAGITISYIMGDNSVFKKASDAKVQTEIGKIEERAQVIYADKLVGNASSDLSTKVETSQIIEQLRNEGYTIKQRTVSLEDIEGISLDKENITMGKNKTEEVKITFLGVEEPFMYYIEVQGKYYQMYSNKGFITIDRNASNLTKEDFENSEDGGTEGNLATLTITSSDESIATAVLKQGSNNTIEITSKEKEEEVTITVTYGSLEQKTCKVKVKEPVLATALEINSVRARIAKDYTRWLTAVATPSKALQEFEWSSSNTSIATVDNKGIVTAKKAGKTTITVKTKDGSNKSQTCEVTIVENAPDVATLTDFQTENTVAKDENGNLITVPGDFKVLVSEGIKVTQGIVIQDKEGNEFVWVPVDSVSTGTSKVADDIRLGRYEDFTTKNASGNYIPKQEADNYTQVVTIGYGGNFYQELTSNSGNAAAKNLGDFITKTKVNGGYYLGRYEASKGSDNKVKSQADKAAWPDINQPNAAMQAQGMYNSNYIESDLINSYSWDTAIVFIQKYSGNSNYANKSSINTSFLNTGKVGDKVCNIHDMASNYYEWTSEYCNYGNGSYPHVLRGGKCGGGDSTTSYRSGRSLYAKGADTSFRPLCWPK